MKTIKYLAGAIILLLGLFLLTADMNLLDSCCPRGGSGGSTPAPSTPAPPSGETTPTTRPPAPSAPPRPQLGPGLMPLIQSAQSLLGVAEPWEAWWTRNRDRYLAFRETIEWANIVDQGGTKSFSISPIYDELLNALVDGVADKDIYLAFRAAIALGKAQDSQNPAISSPKAIEALKKANETETRYFVANNVLIGWGLTSDISVIPILKNILQTKNPPLKRSYAALALGYLPGDSDAPKILRDLLTAEKENAEVKSSVCLSLGNLKDTSAVPVLGKILTGDGGKKEQGMIRAYAALALGRIGTKEALDELKKIAPGIEKDEDVRVAAVTAMGMTGLPEAKDAILALLQDKAPSVKGMACVALAQIKYDKAYETISEALLKNKSPNSDGLMLIGMGLTGHEKAKTDLRKILADNKKSRALLRGAAAIALGLLKDTETLPTIVNILKDEKQQNDTILTPYLLLTLAMLNEQKKEEIVVEGDGIGSKSARIKELSDLEKQTLDILQKMWSKADKSLSITAYTNLVIALMKLTSREKMTEELLKHIGSKDATLRTYALHTLGLIGNKATAKAFVEAYKDNNPEVRKAAITGIGFLMDKHPVNPIDKVTADNIDISNELEIMKHLLPIPVW
ncbi:MAG: HEAT repeat domain-containing protein [Planctomycetes bacterium]|nr:HEAT repeat domain-containing protein [Planctomycetota bacterium]